MDKFRDRKFMLLLYTDNVEHTNALKIIREKYSDYAFILHDKDVDSNGEVKKPHYHVVLKVGDNAVWNTSLAKSLGIDVRFCGEKIRDYVKSLEYLIHYNEKDKHKYDLSEVEGSLALELEKILIKRSSSEVDRVSDIIIFIDEFNGYLSIRELSIYCISSGFWSEFRRNFSILKCIVDEHNSRVICKNGELILNNTVDKFVRDESDSNVVEGSVYAYSNKEFERYVDVTDECCPVPSTVQEKLEYFDRCVKGEEFSNNTKNK